MLLFVLNSKEFSSHMAHISEHINYPNKNIHSYYQMSTIIVNLGNSKCKNNNNSAFKLSSPQNLLLMSIFDTPEKDVSNVYHKSDKKKVRKSLVKSSSTLFYFSIHAIYNRVNRSQKQPLVLNSYIPRIIHQFFQRDITKISFLEN